MAKAMGAAAASKEPAKPPHVDLGTKLSAVDLTELAHDCWCVFSFSAELRVCLICVVVPCQA